MARSIQHLICVSYFLILCSNCAPTRFVKPLEKKQQAASFTFGGPIIRFAGTPIPIPFTTLAYGYGLSNDVTCFGGLHTTSLLFGNLQFDAGATFKLLEMKNTFGISVTPALRAAYHFGAGGSQRLWPSLDANAYYHPGKKPSYIYAGAGSWFELSNYKAHNETVTQHTVLSFNAGYVIVKEKWMHQFQLSLLGAGNADLPGVVDYVGVGGKGALGFHYGLIRKF